MPIYEYRCEACGHVLDALQKFSDAPLSDCPSCKESALKRLISAPSFRLKGSGWYETDFKSEKEKRRNLAETAGSDSGDKGKEGDKAKGGEKAKSPDDKKEKKSDDKPKAKPDQKSGKNKGSEAA